VAMGLAALSSSKGGGISISSVFGDVVWIADAGAGEGMRDGKGPGSCSPPSAKTEEGCG